MSDIPAPIPIIPNTETPSSPAINEPLPNTIVSGTMVEEVARTPLPSLKSIFLICFLSYFIAAIPATFSAFFAGIMAWGNQKWAFLFAFVPVAVLSLLSLLIQSEFFKSKAYRKRSHIYYEAACSSALFVLAAGIGSLCVSILSRGRNSTHTDTLIVYLFIIASVFGAALMNAIFEQRALRKISGKIPSIDGSLKNAGLAVMIISLVLTAGAIYEYGYISSRDVRAYNLSEAKKAAKEHAAQAAIDQKFKEDTNDWFIVPTDGSLTSPSKYTLVERYYEPERDYLASGGGTGHAKADLRSTYLSKSGDGRRFEIVQTNTGKPSTTPPSCTANEVQCTINTTKFGTARCDIAYGRLDCGLITDKGNDLWLMDDDLSNLVDPVAAYNALEARKSPNIKLTR